MSSSQYQRELERKRRDQLDADKRAAEYRAKESSKRSEAAKARQSADRATSDSTRRSRIRDAERCENDATSAAKEATRWQDKAIRYARDAATAQERLTKALAQESERAERDRARAAERADVERQRELDEARRSEAAARAELAARVAQAERALEDVSRSLRSPKTEKLRILVLGADSQGGLRIGREQQRIRNAVQSALHRDYVEFDTRPAATIDELLDGISAFRPHVIHFTGHSNSAVIELEDDRDDSHQPVAVTSQAFRNAILATDEPPLLVVLNSCSSEAQARAIVGDAVPMAIGMSDSIADGDAIAYAARFYATIANGQSVRSAHLQGRVALELAGLAGADLPTLAYAPDIEPGAAVLVKPPTEG